MAARQGWKWEEKRMGKNFKDILIFGHSNIGDVCYDLVEVKPLQQEFPNCRISFICSPKSEDLVKAVSGIDEVIVFDKHGKDRGFFGYLCFIRKIRKKKFDLGIILRGQMHYFFGIPVQIIQNRHAQKERGVHIASSHLKLLERIGIKEAKPLIDFKFSQEEENFAKQVLERGKFENSQLKIGIMPFAGWNLKCWPQDKWNELIDGLSFQFKAEIFVLGKTGESAWEKEFLRNLSQKAISLINQCTLKQSMAILKHLNLFIGPDTSLLHIASCMQVPTIGLYGATDPEFIYPLFHKEYRVMTRSPLPCIPCFPGEHTGSCQVKGRPAECMEAITLEQVLEKIRKVLNIK